MRATFLAFVGLLALSACSAGGSSGPFGWFSNDAPRRAAAATASAGTPVTSIVQAETAPTRNGVIIRATGIAPGQGYYNARLVPASAEAPEGSVLTLVFVADPPRRPQPAGPIASRRLMTALFLMDTDLPQLRTIRIESATDYRSVSR